MQERQEIWRRNRWEVLNKEIACVVVACQFESLLVLFLFLKTIPKTLNKISLKQNYFMLVYRLDILISIYKSRNLWLKSVTPPPSIACHVVRNSWLFNILSLKPECNSNKNGQRLQIIKITNVVSTIAVIMFIIDSITMSFIIMKI